MPVVQPPGAAALSGGSWTTSIDPLAISQWEDPCHCYRCGMTRDSKKYLRTLLAAGCVAAASLAGAAALQLPAPLNSLRHI